MKEFNKKKLLNLKEGTKVLVHVTDEDWWLVCTIESEDNEILLKDILLENSYLVGLDDNYESFCKVYEYSEEDEKMLVKPFEKAKIEEEKEFETIKEWTMSIDWEKKCVNINFHDIHKKIELVEKDIIHMKDSFELLRLKEKGLFSLHFK